MTRRIPLRYWWARDIYVVKGNPQARIPKDIALEACGAKYVNEEDETGSIVKPFEVPCWSPRLRFQKRQRTSHRSRG